MNTNKKHTISLKDEMSHDDPRHPNYEFYQSLKQQPTKGVAIIETERKTFYFELRERSDDK